ncbi:cysteine synthase A [Desulfatiferula olefinivorans]
MTLFNHVDHCIGKTPLVRLERMDRGMFGRILAKAEFISPGGSVKDRLGVALIEDGEERGVINEDTLIVEPTSGNTGIALSLVCARKGYRLCLTMPDSMSAERRKLLAHFGARLELTPGALGMQGAIDRAREILGEEKNAFMPDQFNNPANPAMHRRTTGPEILLDTRGRVDILVCGVGTGGTLTGVAQALKTVNPDLTVAAVEPSASPVLSGGKPGKHLIQGIGAGFVPSILDLSLIDEVIPVADDDALDTARDLARREGILCGISSGAAVWAAMALARQSRFQNKTIVTILPSTGERYISTALFEA